MGSRLMDNQATNKGDLGWFVVKGVKCRGDYLDQMLVRVGLWERGGGVDLEVFVEAFFCAGVLPCSDGRGWKRAGHYGWLSASLLQLSNVTVYSPLHKI